jgi:carbon starvation protein
MTEGGGPIVAFATGFSHLIDALPGLSGPMGLFFGILMINAFVVTTLDTSTRLARFILQEIATDVPVLGNRWGATLITVAGAGWLGASGHYDSIWPVFGATNQLVAALALLVVSSWLMGLKKPRLYTLIPAVFMLLTTIAALIWQIRGFADKGQYFLAVSAGLLVILAGYLTWEARALLKPSRNSHVDPNS